MALTTSDLARLAALARITLSAEEFGEAGTPVGRDLQAVAQVGEVAADDIPPTSHPLPLTNVFREDVVRPCLPREAVLAGAPAAEQDRFRVPRILGEEA